jgi:hypothetical protein
MPCLPSRPSGRSLRPYDSGVVYRELDPLPAAEPDKLILRCFIAMFPVIGPMPMHTGEQLLNDSHLSSPSGALGWLWI